MGRKRWAERRRRPAEGVVIEVGAGRPKIRCGHPYADGSFCMAPASFAHALTHQQATRVADFADELGMPVQPWQQRALAAAREMKAAGISGADLVEAYTDRDADLAAQQAQADEAERRETEELLNRADRMIPAKGLAEAISRYLVEDKMPPMFTAGAATEHANYRRPTYDVLKAAAAERQHFTTDQAQTMLSAALGTRPHLAARVIEKLGPVLAGELARAVDAAVSSGITGYLSAERAELNRLYEDQAAKLRAEQDQAKRGRDVNTERWATPSRLA